MTDNFYDILEIPSDADEREIKTAYHRLARSLHPDKAATPDVAKSMEARFAQVSAAYNTLKDPEKRADYDRKLAAENKRAANQPGGGATPPPPRMTATASVLNAGREIPQPTAPPPSTPNPSRPPLGLTPEKSSIAQKAFAKGMQLYKEGNFAKAIEFFEAAIQNNDAEGIYHARLASAMIQARKSATRAIDAAQRAIDLEPYNLEYKFNLAIVFEAIGSKSNAKKIYEEILRWDAGNARASIALEALKKNKSAFSFNAASDPKSAAGGFFQKLLGKLKK